jgi:hypothetical protein
VIPAPAYPSATSAARRSRRCNCAWPAALSGGVISARPATTMRRKASPRTWAASGSRRAIASATVDFPAPMRPVITTTAGCASTSPGCLNAGEPAAVAQLGSQAGTVPGRRLGLLRIRSPCVQPAGTARPPRMPHRGCTG